MGKNKPSNKKIFWWVGGIFVLLIGGGLILRVTGVIGQNTGEIEVETATAKLKTITQLVSSSGRIQPEVEVIIRPDVSGEIIELSVKEGDFVKKGDLLVRIKPDIFQARIDELNAALLTQKARLEQTRASLIQAESAFRKNKELYDKDLISELEFTQIKSEYESQKASLKASEYQVESAQAQLRRAKEELDQTVIRAPQDGTVTGLDVEAGERVLGNTQMAGTEMMRISLLDKMEVLVEVNENDIVNVNLADTARIEVDAYPERRFNGIVTEIANSARTTGAGTNEQITNYQVKVRIVTPHNLAMSGTELRRTETSENVSESFAPNFKPGMSATVDVETETAVNVTSVPIQAVTIRDFSKDKASKEEGESASESADVLVVKEDIRKVVFVVENGKAVRKEVETGISDNSHIQILSGIDTGDEVVIGSYRTLSKTLNDGDAVKVSDQQIIALAH
ncbi:efflux RND transporter periplasmic adaptor subunit [Balneola sp. MJW-20]|uniref:efflux RND transporter periplasmic adaptor subunit n=1 Tax=Gracilimonas aurantiaca TaxID=3234185 RepID=UPI003465CB7F